MEVGSWGHLQCGFGVKDAGFGTHFSPLLTPWPLSSYWLSLTCRLGAYYVLGTPIITSLILSYGIFTTRCLLSLFHRWQNRCLDFIWLSPMSSGLSEAELRFEPKHSDSRSPISTRLWAWVCWSESQGTHTTSWLWGLNEIVYLPQVTPKLRQSSQEMLAGASSINHHWYNNVLTEWFVPRWNGFLSYELVQECYNQVSHSNWWKFSKRYISINQGNFKIPQAL